MIHAHSGRAYLWEKRSIWFRVFLPELPGIAQTTKCQSLSHLPSSLCTPSFRDTPDMLYVTWLSARAISYLLEVPLDVSMPFPVSGMVTTL